MLNDDAIAAEFMHLFMLETGCSCTDSFIGKMHQFLDCSMQRVGIPELLLEGLLQGVQAAQARACAFSLLSFWFHVHKAEP